MDERSEAERGARIVNTEGLHARPCHDVVAIALEYECEFRVACRGTQVDGRSVMTLMTLGAAVGDELLLWARGEGAQELVERVARLVEAGFDESA
ncbi:MAG: HPr family phosphocarrier protein [Planctomycetota bacterium]|jgi:phosphotransferase system HPr (HPr) family protein|nr:HPr family phosphocarrier protein [Planctomycetota bacterium]MDP6990634.1 HPr family phosphocarrier protein [Planctomycetota bacterium]